MSVLPQVIAVAVAALFVVTGAPAAYACFHAMNGPPPNADLTYVAAWADGRQDIVVVTDHRFQPDESKLAFVLPVPAVPTAYDVVDAKGVYTLRQHVGLRKRMPLMENPKSAMGASSPVRQLRTEKVGPYTIKPLQVTGEEGVESLNAWLHERAFGKLPAEGAAYYAERDWTFLAIEMSPPEEGSSGSPALHVRFETPRIVLPMKLLGTAEPGVGDPGSTHSVEAFILGGTHLPQGAMTDLEQKGLVAVSGETTVGSTERTGLWVLAKDVLKSNEAPASVGALVSKLVVADQKELAVSWVFAERINSKVFPLTWDEDLVLPPLDPGRQLTGGSTMAPMPAGVMRPREDHPDWPNWADADAPEPKPPKPSGIQIIRSERPAKPMKIERMKRPSSCSGCSVAARTAGAEYPLLLIAFLATRRRRRSG